MFKPVPVEIVAYDEGTPVLRVTRHGGGTFVDLYSDKHLYSRRVYRGGGYRGTREEEAEVIAALDPVYAEGYRLVIPHRFTAVIDELREAEVDDRRVPTVEDVELPEHMRRLRLATRRSELRQTHRHGICSLVSRPQAENVVMLRPLTTVFNELPVRNASGTFGC
jgi:hypothetical protein